MYKRCITLLAILLIVGPGFLSVMGGATASDDVSIDPVIFVNDNDGNVHFVWIREGNIHYTNEVICPNPKPLLNQLKNNNQESLYALLQTPNAKPIQISYSDDESYSPYIEITEDGMIHIGWIEYLAEEEHVFYARSTNMGKTWWYFDASEYAADYLQACGLSSIATSTNEQINIVRTLEMIYIIDGCHYFYVPIEAPPIIPPITPSPVTPILPGEEVYVSIDDPYLTGWNKYEYIIIDDRQFIKPICGPEGIPFKPPRAPDIAIEMLGPAAPSLTFDELEAGVFTGDSTLELLISNLGNAEVSGEINLALWLSIVEINDDIPAPNLNIPISIHIGALDELAIEIPLNDIDFSSPLYIIGKIDSGNAIDEGNEVNNIMWSSADWDWQKTAHYGPFWITTTAWVWMHGEDKEDDGYSCVACSYSSVKIDNLDWRVPIFVEWVSLWGESGFTIRSPYHLYMQPPFNYHVYGDYCEYRYGYYRFEFTQSFEMGVHARGSGELQDQATGQEYFLIGKEVSAGNGVAGYQIETLCRNSYI